MVISPEGLGTLETLNETDSDLVEVAAQANVVVVEPPAATVVAERPTAPGVTGPEAVVVTDGLLPIALTCDDAPSIQVPGATAGSIRFDPRRMDRLRTILEQAGVRHCTAFVVGATALAHLDVLERWLAAGFQLANHTYDHRSASGTTVDAFIASIRHCDHLLQRIGAFDDGRKRFFRYPYGDRGASVEARRRIFSACSDLGYTVAHVTIDWFDHRFEAPLAEAVANQDHRRARTICARYLAAADRATWRMVSLSERVWPKSTMHIATCHFGLVSEECLERLVAKLAPHVAWQSLTAASKCDPYQAYDSDFSGNGILADHVGRPGIERVLQRLARLSMRFDLFEQRRYGPRWPHLT